MAQVWERWGTVLTASAVAVPVLVAIVWALARWRTAGVVAADRGREPLGGEKPSSPRPAARSRSSAAADGAATTVRRAAWLRSGAEVGAVAGTLPWLWMVMTPRPADSAVNPVPLTDLAVLVTATPSTLVVQLVGNLLVFAALGFCLPVRFRVSVATVAAVAGAAGMGIEALQYLLDLGRVSSVDDVLVNTLGAVLAAALSRPWWATRIATTAIPSPSPSPTTSLAR